MTITIHMATQCCIPGDFNPQQNRCGNLKYFKGIFVMIGPTLNKMLLRRLQHNLQKECLTNVLLHIQQISKLYLTCQHLNLFTTSLQ